MNSWTAPKSGYYEIDYSLYLNGENLNSASTYVHIEEGDVLTLDSLSGTQCRLFEEEVQYNKVQITRVDK